MTKLAKPMPPCKNCKDRSITCHSKCEKYISFVNKNEEYKKSLQGTSTYGDGSWTRVSNLVKAFRKTRS